MTWAEDAAGWLDEADLAPCGRCGKDVTLAYEGVCAHGYVACPECGHEAVCVRCRLAAEHEMHASGDYSERADPFFDATPEAKASDDAYWAKTRRGWWDLGRGPRPAGKDAS